jgi:ABC-type phosphonate transport system ATPase subunit
MSRVDRRLLFLGDWNWLVRDPLDVLRLVFFAGTIAFAVAGRSTAVG